MRNGSIRIKASLFEILIAIYYTWYLLPVLRGVFASSLFKNLFFSFYIVGVVGVIFQHNWKINFPKLIMIVLSYFCIILVLSFMGIGDASNHLRVSFTFWGTGLLTFMLYDDKQKQRLCSYIILLLIITVITSSIGVSLHRNAARALADSKVNDDLQLSYKLRNIASIYLFQSFSAFVPMIIAATTLNQNKRYRTIGILVCIGLLLVVINASFTIAFLAFLMSIVLTIIYKNAKGVFRYVVPLLLFVFLGVIYIFSGEIIQLFIRIIPNEAIVHKLTQMRYVLVSEGGDNLTALTRFRLYLDSWNTFLQHPLGVGPKYAYTSFIDGIGYHSQILDDLARYGLFALLFYIMFFVYYHKALYAEWGKIQFPYIADAITVIYVLLLTLNIGFKSPEESVVFLLLAPVLPSVLETRYGRSKQA